MRKQFVDTVSKIVQEDEKAVLLLGDIGVYGFKDLLNNYPLRAYNIGILEQTTISVAAGMSLQGLIPIVHTIAPFIVERALEQYKSELQRDMKLMGCTKISDLNRKNLRFRKT